MIRILHFCSDSNIGGAGKTLLRLLEHSDKSKFEHYVALPENSLLSVEAESLAVTVIYYNASPDTSYSLRAITEFKQIITKISPHIVHTHGNVSARIAAYLCGIRSRIYTRHTYSKATYSLLSQLINDVITTKAVAVNKVLVLQIVSSGIKKEKISVIENGCEAHIKDGICDTIRSHENGAFVLLYHGRIEKEKGLDIALEAVSKLNHGKHTCKLLIAGEGSYKEDLIKKARDLSVCENVEFVAFTNDVCGLLHRADAVINCSFIAEGTSNSLIEAMSAGKLIIASNVGGNSNLIDNEKNGLLFKSRDVDSFCVCVERIANDILMYKKLCEGAALTYKNRFGVDKMTRGYEKLWEEEYKKYYEAK